MDLILKINKKETIVIRVILVVFTLINIYRIRMNSSTYVPIFNNKKDLTNLFCIKKIILTFI